MSAPEDASGEIPETSVFGVGIAMWKGIGQGVFWVAPEGRAKIQVCMYKYVKCIDRLFSD